MELRGSSCVEMRQIGATMASLWLRTQLRPAEVCGAAGFCDPVTMPSGNRQRFVEHLPYLGRQFIDAEGL
jgi:hypothetical protein